MPVTLVLLATLILPSPTRPAYRPPSIMPSRALYYAQRCPESGIEYERSPMWGRYHELPVQFQSLPHQSFAMQRAASDAGRQRAADLQTQLNRGRIPVVGQFQQSVSVGTSRSFTTSVPAGK